MPIGKAKFAAALVLVAGVCGFAWPWMKPLVGTGFTTGIEDHAVYFRLKAKYQHKGEIIDFDVVAGCGVRVTDYADGDRSYDASRSPVIFAKATSDGGAIWQIMPAPCSGETTDNGEVPADFLPGAIWFDSKDDFSFGTAYVTEDAFSNSKSELKFLGASIERASRENWDAFSDTARQNLVDSRPYTWGNPRPTVAEIQENLWNKAKLVEWRPTLICHLVQRYPFSKELDRAIVREVWPGDQPRFWMPSPEQFENLRVTLGLFGKVEVGGVRMSRYFSFGHYQSRAFPTRAGGGMLGRATPTPLLPPEIFPLRSDDGIPWATPALAQGGVINRYIDYDNGVNRGFAYCYSSFRQQDEITKQHLPSYLKQKTATFVDDQAVIGESSRTFDPVTSPGVIFERDEAYFVYNQFTFY